MSVVAYGAMTRRREQSRPREAGSNELAEDARPDRPAPVGQATLDTFAALVPAELLVAHATILQFTTQTDNDVVTITEPDVLAFSFWALAVAGLLMYVMVKASAWSRPDFLRMFIPPLAFVGWTMIQKSTAFDAVFTMNNAMRVAVAVIVALLLAVAARTLAYKADEFKG